MRKVSIVVCTYNRSASLRETLASLQNLLVPEGYEVEIFAVDNRSTDDTRRVIEKSAAGARIPVRYIYEARQGASHARNAGIQSSKGEIICFFDDDVLVDSKWLAAMLKLFEETDAEMAGCRILRKWECPVPNWYTEEVGGPVIAQDLGTSRKVEFKKGQYLISAGLAFRSQVFEKIGIFRPDLGRKGNSLIGGEDKELFERVKSAGGVICYEPEAVIYHRVEESRLTPDYMRRWFYAIGQTAGHQLERLSHHALTLAPVWAWGDFFRAVVRSLRSLNPNTSEAERLASVTQLLYTAGYLRECFVHWLPASFGQRFCVFRKD